MPDGPSFLPISTSVTEPSVTDPGHAIPGLMPYHRHTTLKRPPSTQNLSYQLACLLARSCGPWMNRWLPPDYAYVLRLLRTLLLTTAHCSPGTGHQTSTTLSLLQYQHWWPGMARDVCRFVAGCADCAMAKTPHYLPAGKLVPLPVPRRPWSHLRVNYVTGLAPSNDTPVSCSFSQILQGLQSCCPQRSSNHN